MHVITHLLQNILMKKLFGNDLGGRLVKYLIKCLYYKGCVCVVFQKESEVMDVFDVKS